MKYCTSFELAEHNHEGSLWVAIFGNVLDLTELVAKHSGDETRAIVEAAGQDISHWFTKGNTGTVELKTHIHPVTGLPAPYLPWISSSQSPPPSSSSSSSSTPSTPGTLHQLQLQQLQLQLQQNKEVGGVYPTGPRLLHAAAVGPHTGYSTSFTVAWFQDPSVFTARLTSLPRKIKIINSLTTQEHILDVCGEESLNDIKHRYLEYNKHADSYSWKRLGVPLNIHHIEKLYNNRRKECLLLYLYMDKTLEENGIKDEREEMLDLQVDDEAYIPAIHLYFIDDLTIA